MIFLKRHMAALVLISLFCCTTSFTAETKELVLPEKLGDFSLTKPVATYTPANLFELINGQAVFYLSYGFVGLEHAFYQKGDAQYQVDLYELRSDLSALGCYRQQRDTDAEPLTVGAEGSIIDYLTVFFKGSYYVEIIPYDGEVDNIIGEMTTLAETLDACIPATASLPKELSYFPEDGKTPGSGLYIGENLLSYTFLGHGITAEYTGADSKTFRAFISLAETDDDAKNIVSEFGTKLSSRKTITLPDGHEGVSGEMPYRGNAMIVSFGSYAIGTLGHGDNAAAQALAASIIRNISSKTGGK